MASIKKRPDGRYRARYRDEYGREHARHFRRRVDAQAWLDEVTASVVTGTYADPRAGRTTLEAYFKQWSASQPWVPATVYAATRAVESTPFRARPIKSVTTSQVQAWVKSLQQPSEVTLADGTTTTRKGLAPATIAARYGHVRQVFLAAVRDRVIGVNPSAGVKLPRRRKAQNALEIPTPAEVGVLLATAEVWFRPYVALCAFAGLRKGEASAVKVEDVDWIGRRLHVQRQVQREHGQMVVRAPKFESERTVSLPDELIEMLSVHVRDTGVHPDGWLFVGHDGPLRDTAVDYHWRELRKVVDLTTKLHGLRHFFASGLIAQGCDVVTVQRAMGHRSATITLDIYGHLWPNAEDRTRKAASTFMAEALGAKPDHPADSGRTAKPRRRSDKAG